MPFEPAEEPVVPRHIAKGFTFSSDAPVEALTEAIAAVEVKEEDTKSSDDGISVEHGDNEVHTPP